ncbi:MAG: carbon-nitrogen hydrolase family protein [Bacteroidales bacterium]|nr:MAG: carbon-nitrogen hydrolase family protein [Bacteroidales bacterium]
MKKSPSVRSAVIQSSPVLFDKKSTLEKAVALIRKAGEEEARLILFPEAFIPAYPRGLTFGSDVGNRSDAGREVWQIYFDNAVEIPGPETDVLCKAAIESGAYISMGMIEKDLGTLFCTQLFISPEGTLAGKHRKIKPTASERIIWGEGDGTTLTTYSTGIGKIGGLICWENYMPLARFAMYRKGVQIYLAPTADHREIWQVTMRHIAIEGGCFVLGCNQYTTPDMYPEEIKLLENLDDPEKLLCRGGSIVVNPFGEVISGPLWDKEGILYADLNMDQITKRKMDLDVAGHYSRPDIFELHVRGQPDIISCNPEDISGTK